MKKLQRVFALIMAIVMMMGTVSMTAFATEGESGTTANEPSTLVEKSADGLDKNDQTNVTLTVPGMKQGVGTDIVFIMGAGPAHTGKMLELLKGSMRTLIKEFEGTGAEVKLGLVCFADTTEKETVLPLTVMKETDENNQAADDLDYIIQNALDSYMNRYSGVNLESALITARDMLAADTTVPAERKHMILISTGYGWCFDDEEGNPATIVGTNKATKGGVTQEAYVWGQLYHQNARWATSNTGNNSDGLRIPFGWTWKQYWNKIQSWVAADGDKYVFTIGYNELDKDGNVKLDENGDPIFVPTTYSEMYNATETVDGVTYINSNSAGLFGNTNYRFGAAIQVSKYKAAAAKVAVPFFTQKTTPGTGSTNALNANHALNYERGMYDSWVVYNQMNTATDKSFTTVFGEEIQGLGYNCYAVVNFMGNNDRYVNTETKKYFGQCFMDFLNGGEAPMFSTTDDSFFDPIAKEIIYSCSDGSKVTDYIGSNENGNFEFITDPKTISVTFGTETYKAIELKPAKEGATASYTFSAEGSEKVSFELDYYYGDGETTERLEWTFHEDVSLEKKASLTYKLQLTAKKTTDGTYTVPTNNKAYLDPIDSKDNKGERQWFPVPEVDYTVKTFVTISGTKEWNDDENRDGIRPEKITVILKADGEKVAEKEISAESQWTFNFTDLPAKDESGKAIVYTVDEAEVPAGYNKSVAGTTITNTHTPATVSVSGTKVWEDGNDQDGLRPDSITIKLLADGQETGKSATVTADGEWAFEFENLPKFNNGEAIEYTVSEDEVEGYETVIVMGEEADGVIPATVTNTYEPETVTVSGTKIWDDANNQDGKRPANIKVILLADGERVDEQTVTGHGNEWSFEFTDLPKNKNVNGEVTEIVYTIAEIEVPQGYQSIPGDDNTITNKYTPGKISVTVTKKWVDGSNQDGVRPESITIILLADGEQVATQTISGEGNEWTCTFADLPEYANGQKIVYTVDEGTEAEAAGYTKSISGTTITNSRNVELTQVSGKKVWDDNNDQDGIRPERITIILKADGEQVDTQTISGQGNEWAFEFTGLPKYKNGQAIEYTVAEIEVEGYTSKVEGTTITNSQKEYASVTVSGKKVWNDGNDQDGLRPDVIEVILYADGVEVDRVSTNKELDNWTFKFTDLPANKDGKAIEYTVDEAEVPAGYTKTVSGTTITNTHTPATVSVSGTKTWIDDNNRDGLRPEEITIRLLADGEEIDSATVSATTGWAYEFTNLPKYAAGVEITYAITEDAVVGYESAIDGYDVTNKHTTLKTSITVTKVWEDDNNQDGLRPSNITVKLYADGAEVEGKSVTLSANNNWTYTWTNLPANKDGKAIEYTVDETEVPTGYTKTVSGTTITNTHVSATVSVEGKKVWNDNNDQDGKRPANIVVILKADGVEYDRQTVEGSGNEWTFKFTDLPANKDGKAIVYTVDEAEVPAGYTKTVSGTTITNAHTPATVSVSGTKTWIDDNNRDGLRPEEITIRLKADGAEIDSATVSATTGWAYEFTNLPKYAAGVEIVYTITEDTVDGYTPSINGYDVTNSYTPGKTSVTVSKIWEDDNNQDGLRPAFVTVKLLADGQETGKTATLSVDNQWTATFTDLFVKEAGEAIEYTVAEVEVEGYETEITGDATIGFTITNTHVSATVSVEGKKVWVDADNQDGIRPANIVVILKADGVECDRQTVEGSGNEWTFKFTNLPANKDGKAIEYTVDEAEVPAGYTKSVAGTTITNAHTPATVSVSGTKTWIDDNNRDGLRPEEITVRLKADGAEIDSATVSATTGWAYEFTNLPKYAAGVEIVYTITEDTVDGYTPSINGYDVTNSYTPGKTSVSVTKVWEDGNDYDRIRPEEITVILLANGQETGKTVTLSADNQWTATFTDLFVKEAGEAIEYTVAEVEVEGYETEITGDATVGFTITNTHEPTYYEEDVVTVRKVWSGDTAANRPASVTVQLKNSRTGAVQATATLSAANGWSATFYVPANEFWTVEEVNVPANYTSRVSSSNGLDFTVTNTYTTEIEEPRVPMGTPGGDTVILDDDVPLADVPKTGDPLTVMAAMSILSGAGVFFTRKKREDEE